MKRTNERTMRRGDEKNRDEWHSRSNEREREKQSPPFMMHLVVVVVVVVVDTLSIRLIRMIMAWLSTFSLNRLKTHKLPQLEKQLKHVFIICSAYLVVCYIYLCLCRCEKACASVNNHNGRSRRPAEN